MTRLIMTTPSASENTDAPLTFERVAPIFLLTFVDILGLTVILPLLHLYAIAFGASPLEIGLVAAAFPLAQLVGAPVMGALSDRFGRKPLLLISQVTTCISFVLLATAGSLWMVIFSRAFDGLFGANISTAQAAMSDITGAENRARGLGITGAAFGLGFMFGPAIAALALEFSDNLGAAAWIAAGYSLLSILLTLFVFRETLPPERRTGRRGLMREGLTGKGLMHQTPTTQTAVYQIPMVVFLLALMFAQQVVFYGFESLLGLFTLNRIGLLGQGVAVIFVVVGVLLVLVQTRMIGGLTRRLGEARVATLALVLLGAGLLLLAATPTEPHPFYVRQIVENEIARLAPSGTEAVIGDIRVDIPARALGGGVLGIGWLLAALAVIALGAGLIRPSLNSLLTQRVAPSQYGAVLGASAAAVSAANAVAPLLGGLLVQAAGISTPLLLGGALMLALAGLSAWRVRGT
jgi:MFS family permease